MSYPRTPNERGEYTEPDGRIRISRERYERLVGATEPATRTQELVKAALDLEFVMPGPQASLSQEALDVPARLVVDAAREGLGIASALAAKEYLMSCMDVNVDG